MFNQSIHSLIPQPIYTSQYTFITSLSVPVNLRPPPTLRVTDEGKKWRRRFDREERNHKGVRHVVSRKLCTCHKHTRGRRGGSTFVCVTYHSVVNTDQKDRKILTHITDYMTLQNRLVFTMYLLFYVVHSLHRPKG